MTHVWFYPDKVSAKPDETVRLFASASTSPCLLTVSRVGRSVEKVAEFKDIAVGNHPTPDNADANGCGWPEAFNFKIGHDWATGYYDIALSLPSGEVCHHFVVVRKADQAPKAKAAIIISTNTYFSYNYWGGANSYAHVDDLMAGKLTPEDARAAAIGSLSRMRPLAQGMFAPPLNSPRLINYTRRAKDEMALPGDVDWMAKHQPSPYDGSAGYLQKWEHRFSEWMEAHNFSVDYLCDHDFETEDPIASDYKVVLLVGHSEYWSGKQRAALDRFVDTGGKLIIFSGNTCYWKVRWEDDGQTLIAHKARGETNDPLWEDPDTRADATHYWSHEAFDSPEARLTGLSFIYGGYHRLCACVARGAAAYTIYNDTHWALEDTDLYYGDLLGTDVPLIGYENDGCPLTFGEDGLPKPAGGVGVPNNLEIIGVAPATLGEDPRSPYPPLIPPEDMDTCARLAYGATNDVTKQRLMRGHAVMASFKRGEGEVFNGGTTEWAHGLAAKDAFLEKITLNVFARFGLHADTT